MPDLATWLIHGRYVALAAVIVLGNVGLPVPEETVLILAGYLIREGHLRLVATLLVGILSAVVGDNLGYWLGRVYGRPVVLRGALWARLTPARVDRIQRFVARYGVIAVVVARFVVGFRMLAGPVAGASGLRALPFMAANLLGAVLFVPYALGLGYAVGPGVRASVEYVRTMVNTGASWLLIGALVLALAVAGARARRRRSLHGRDGSP